MHRHGHYAYANTVRIGKLDRRATCADAVENLAKHVYANDMARPRVAHPTEPITTRLPNETIEALRRVAVREERPLSQVMARLLRDRLVQLGDLPKPTSESAEP